MTPNLEGEPAVRVARVIERRNAGAGVKEFMQWAVEDAVETFKDEQGEPYVHFWDGPMERLLPVLSTEYRDAIRLEIINTLGVPHENWLEGIVQYIAALARRSPTKTLSTRQARGKADLWLFQLTPSRTLAIDTKGAIHELALVPVFYSWGHQRDLDVRLDSTLEDLRRIEKYLPFKEPTERELFLSCLVALLVPGISKPIQMFRGPPGSAKTTGCRVLKAVIDPSYADRGSPYPKNEGDWFVMTRHHAVVFLDNLAFLSHEQQDELCRVVTGMTIEKRKLYTDADVVGATIHAVIVINAIDLGGLQSDFLDRSFIWDIRRISDEERKPESQLMRDFEQDLPYIRGACFRILAAARLLVDNVPPSGLRLADFARWAAACHAARGLSPDQFHTALAEKIALQKDETLTQSALPRPLESFFSTRNTWEGSAEDLLDALTTHAYPDGRVPKAWPRNPATLGRELSRIEHLLPLIGLTVSRPQRTGTRRVLKIAKISETTVTTVTDSVKPLNSWVTGANVSDSKENSSCHLSVIPSPKDASVTAGDGNVTGECAHPSPSFVVEKNAAGDGVTAKSPIMFLKLMSVQDIPRGIRAIGGGGPVLAANLVERWSGTPEGFETAVEVLTKRGDLYEPRPGFLAVRD